MELHKVEFFAKGAFVLSDRTEEIAPVIYVGNNDEPWHWAPIVIHVPHDMRDTFARACAAFNAVMAEAEREKIGAALNALLDAAE